MDLGIISMRYAKALLRFAEEQRQESQVYTEMQTLATSFARVPALQSALLNPVAGSAEKVRLLTVAACGKAEASAATTLFLQLVVRKGRADVMQFVAHSFCSIYRQTKHIINARLVVPTQVDDEVIARLRKMVEGKTNGNIQFEMEVNPEIEGGFILEYGTYRLDASLRTQISKLKRQLAK